jgi:hypothetical protein
LDQVGDHTNKCGTIAFKNTTNVIKGFNKPITSSPILPYKFPTLFQIYPTLEVVFGMPKLDNPYAASKTSKSNQCLLVCSKYTISSQNPRILP